MSIRQEREGSRLSRTDSVSFAKISDCTVTHDVDRSSDVYLIFDIDWACNSVLADTINLVERADVAAVYNYKVNTPIRELLSRDRLNKHFSLCQMTGFSSCINATGIRTPFHA